MIKEHPECGFKFKAEVGASPRLSSGGKLNLTAHAPLTHTPGLTLASVRLPARFYEHWSCSGTAKE